MKHGISERICPAHIELIVSSSRRSAVEIQVEIARTRKCKIAARQNAWAAARAQVALAQDLTNGAISSKGRRPAGDVDRACWLVTVDHKRAQDDQGITAIGVACRQSQR